MLPPFNISNRRKTKFYQDKSDEDADIFISRTQFNKYKIDIIIAD